VVVVYLIGVALMLNATDKPGGMGSAGDFKIHLLQVIGVLAGVGALIAIYCAEKTWSDRQQWFWYRLWNVLLAAACAGFFWFIWYWHLLNFNLNY
jgi:hypothetical protein